MLTGFICSLAKELDNAHEMPEAICENLVDMIALAFSSSVMLEQVESHSIVKESIKRRVRHCIEKNFSNPNLSNVHIAENQRISVRYMHKLFQDEDESVHDLIQRRRLETARGLLLDPRYAGHSIEQIAFTTGFASGAHFSRSFKRRYGLSPSDLR